MPGLDWLTAQPVAHRGLHDAKSGAIENTASAFRAAIESGFAIETDLQLSGDGEAMVHHDFALGRLTLGTRQLGAMTAAGLKEVPFRDTGDRMMTIGEMCDLVAGRTPMLVELKSRFAGERRLVERTAQVLKNYSGPVAVMSFDPDFVEALREVAPGLPRGIVAERNYVHQEWKEFSAAKRRNLAFLLHAFRSRPHFVAYWVNELPAVAPWVARHIFGLPLLTWTVRTPDQRARAARHADQMIFEGFTP